MACRNILKYLCPSVSMSQLQLGHELICSIGITRAYRKTLVWEQAPQVSSSHFWCRSRRKLSAQIRREKKTTFKCLEIFLKYRAISGKPTHLRASIRSYYICIFIYFTVVVGKSWWLNSYRCLVNLRRELYPQGQAKVLLKPDMPWYHLLFL